MRTGRNESCHCGSGKKYKNCCIGEERRQSSRGAIILVSVLMAVAAAGVIVPRLLPEKNEARTVATAPRAPRAAKVWSEEHGHWHDAAAPAGGGAPISPAMTPLPPPSQQQNTYRKPQPPGPAPEGKVWSPEHGHWHDVKK